MVPILPVEDVAGRPSVRMFPDGIGYAWTYGSHKGSAVYGLFDPDGTIRYVGMTRRGVRHRYQSHIWPQWWDARSPKAKWIEGLHPDWPRVAILDEVAVEDGPAAERRWIEHYCTRDAHCSLTNVNEHLRLHAWHELCAVPIHLRRFYVRADLRATVESDERCHEEAA